VPRLSWQPYQARPRDWAEAPGALLHPAALVKWITVSPGFSGAVSVVSTALECRSTCCGKMGSKSTS
jgi:hypothetical protein